ncbi:GntR family transcriptional regulator [Streptococcus macacae]|uniref:UbiC transcription regulator-associated domain protein n=1 Tax=Streptococcus macacae NCTC 11558 TaxID=764298 RepID=G5JUB8_9STRE|nr:GntR family transcriptional regulator [Streptococcus macacae]EHJ52043.1 UbiC transcription regulator-associated domain protein [Streptococcus macacae NCTC 11558]SUN78481.1 GntR family transcriptional regulator [Streptococcus macacae NCTC 11558]
MLPAYIRIHDHIKKEIDKSLWKIGDRLPSERDLADQFKVSRMTLRQAITLLVDEGILERRIGSGTYVASSRVQEKMTGTTSFTQIVSSQGKIPSTKVISYQRVHPNEQETGFLNIKPNSYVIRMKRVRYADDLPVVFEITAIPERIIKNFKKEDITEHFFQTLTDNGFVIDKSQQTISARNADEQTAHFLEISKGQAVLSLTQVSYFEDGIPFEYVRSQYVGERFEFYLENK